MVGCTVDVVAIYYASRVDNALMFCSRDPRHMVLMVCEHHTGDGFPVVDIDSKVSI